MWTLMPSTAVSPAEKFFNLEDLRKLARRLPHELAIIKGRVWSGDERNHGWAVECESFEEFRDSLAQMENGTSRIEFLAFDEMMLDEDTFRIVQDDLYRYAGEENLSSELVNKALSALRSHENETFAVVAYAFLNSGRVIFVRAQNELARFVYQPDKLLSNEGLSSVRKLKTLIEN